MKSIEKIIIPILAFLLLAGISSAQRPPRPQPVDFDMDVQADSLEYLEESKQMVAIGNVVIQYEQETLRADYVTVNTETMDAFARGNVVMLRDEWEWSGGKLKYNFDTKQGDFGTFEGQSGKYYVAAKESKRLPSGSYEMQDITATTCDKDDMEFKLKATSATMTADKKIKARNVVPYLGPIPFFYLPYAWFDMDKDYSNWDISMGHTGSWGAFLLLGYTREINRNLKTVTHVDMRTKRGLGLGEDLLWQLPDDGGEGKLELYYLNDREPLDNEYDKEYYGDQVDSDRYRLRFQHAEELGPRDYLTADLQYLSDPKIREDFFERDYRLQSQPENRVSLSHRGDNYSAGLLFNTRLNDFYENIDRMPELTLDLQRQKLGDSKIYYESDNSISRLKKVFAEQSDGEDFESTRLDTHHTLYYPRKYLGYLNLIPSAGFRGTYYSDLAPETSSMTNTVTLSDTNGTTYTTNQVNDIVTARGSDLRSFFEFGLESSFKAFKIISEDANDFGSGLRHVVEPHADYRLRTKPSVEPDEIYHFDSIDTIGKQNEIFFGARNKLQTKREGMIADIFDIDVFTSLRLDPEEDEDSVGPLRIDGNAQPTDLVWLDFDAGYDWDESSVTDFNLRMNLGGNRDTRAYINYGFRDDNKNLLAADFDYYPTPDWGLGLYTRYDIDDSEVEENRVSVLHRMDCVGWEVGLRSLAGRGGEEDDNELWLKVWLLAFPKMEIKFFDASY